MGVVLHLLICIFCIHTCMSSEFYTGMFKKNDFLVASDRLFKPRVPFGYSVAKYGRVFKCPITYVRLTDRLNVGRGPKVNIIRGGLKHKLVVLKITGPYNQPISANIYVGCENKHPPTTTTEATTTEKHADNPTTPKAS